MIQVAIGSRPVRFAHLALAGFVGIAALAGCSAETDEFDNTSADAIRACSGSHRVQGIDVAEFQGNIDWSAVRHSGHVFGVARISDGTYHDPYFTQNWHAMHRAGMIRGAYQFIRPNDDPAMLAHIVVRAVGRLRAGDLPVTADVECTPDQGCTNVPGPSHYARWLRIWAHDVEVGTGRPPIIYTFKSYWDDQLGGSRSFENNPLWIAAYDIQCPNIPAPWHHWGFHQYTDHGAVPGITREAPDHDLFNGTLDELRHLAYLTPRGTAVAATSTDPSTSSTGIATNASAIVEIPPDDSNPNDGAEADELTPEESGTPDDPPPPTDPSTI